MSLLSLLGFKSPGIGVCCGEVHDELRMALAREIKLRWHLEVALRRVHVLTDELDRARDVAGTFLCCDGIDHGEPS